MKKLNGAGWLALNEEERHAQRRGIHTFFEYTNSAGNIDHYQINGPSRAAVEEEKINFHKRAGPGLNPMTGSVLENDEGRFCCWATKWATL